MTAAKRRDAERGALSERGRPAEVRVPAVSKRRNSFAFGGLKRRTSMPDAAGGHLKGPAGDTTGDTTPTTASASWTSPNNSDFVERLSQQQAEAAQGGVFNKLTRRMILPSSLHARKP